MGSYSLDDTVTLNISNAARTVASINITTVTKDENSKIKVQRQTILPDSFNPDGTYSKEFIAINGKYTAYTVQITTVDGETLQKENITFITSEAVITNI